MFDLIVIGGGIFGAAAAWHAARRGLQVALIERGDFCSSTSAHSFKVVHGGIRYIQHADIKRVRESAAARRAFLKLAPHLVHPLPFVVPTYGRGLRGKNALRAAMMLYDSMTFDRNAKILDRDRWIPPCRCMSRTLIREHYPSLPSDGLTGAAVFYDGQMHSPPRLVLAFLRSAGELEAVAANYVTADRLLATNGRIVGVRAHDGLTDTQLEIRGRTVLNAAGPGATALHRRSFANETDHCVPWSRDACLVVDREILPTSAALALPTSTRDPDALLDRGGRHLFLVPWCGKTLVGVWHRVYRGDPDGFDVSEQEIAAWIAEVNALYPAANIDRNDVSMVSAGLVPFGNNDREQGHLRFGHRSRLIDHGREDGIEGLFTLIGLRFTMGPIESERAICQIVRRHLKHAAPPRTLDSVFGGNVPSFAGLVSDIERELSGNHSVALALAHAHGSNWRSVIELGRRMSGGLRSVNGTNTLRADIAHSVRHEMAVTLDDVLCRRTQIGASGPISPETRADVTEVFESVRSLGNIDIDDGSRGPTGRAHEVVRVPA